MSPRIAKLGMLVRLRRRDVDRRARVTAERARHAEAAEAALARATRQVEVAIANQARALSDRLTAPADPLVALFCQGCDEALAQARQSHFGADRAAAAAAEELVEARRQWLRAQARLDAMAGMHARALTEHRRAAERRQLDAVIDDRRSPVFA